MDGLKDEAQDLLWETNLGDGQQILDTKKPPPPSLLTTGVEWVTLRCWVVWSWATSWLAWPPSLGNITARLLDWSLNDIDSFRGLGRRIRDMSLEWVLLPLGEVLTFVYFACGNCITNTIPMLLRTGTLSVVGIALGVMLLRVINKIIRHHISNLVGVIYSVFTYQPALISILISLATHGPVHDFLFQYLDTLKDNRWWAAFLFQFWWKAVKIVVHTYSYIFLTKRNLYRPVFNPAFSPKDGLYLPSPTLSLPLFKGLSGLIHYSEPTIPISCILQGAMLTLVFEL